MTDQYKKGFAMATLIIINMMNERLSTYETNKEPIAAHALRRILEDIKFVIENEKLE